MALHLWILSVTNLTSISLFARCIEYVIFVLKSILLFFTALWIWNRSFLTTFCGNFYNFWALLAWVWLLSTCAESYISSVIDDLENFISIAFSVENFPMVVWRWQNWFVVSGCHWSKKSLKKLFQESTLSPYNYDFPERFVQQCDLHFFTRGQFWPSGIVVACVCVSVSLCVNHLLVRAITWDPFKLGSPNLKHRCKRPWLRSLLFWELIELDMSN